MQLSIVMFQLSVQVSLAIKDGPLKPNTTLQVATEDLSRAKHTPKIVTPRKYLVE